MGAKECVALPLHQDGNPRNLLYGHLVGFFQNVSVVQERRSVDKLIGAWQGGHAVHRVKGEGPGFLTCVQALGDDVQLRPCNRPALQRRLQGWRNLRGSHGGRQVTRDHNQFPVSG